MTIIGHPIGNIDESVIIGDIYQLPNMTDGWYFLSLPSYKLVPLDTNPYIDEVIVDGNKILETGYVPVGYLIPPPSGMPFGVPYRDVVYPSGMGGSMRFWELYQDIDDPYTFVPYNNVDSGEQGEILYIDIDTPVPKLSVSVPLMETLSDGMMLYFKEKIIDDYSNQMSLKEKIISQLHVDLQLIDKTKVRLLWGGDEVDIIEILRRGVGESDYHTPYASVPFSPTYYDINLDNNSYTFTVRGALGTGKSLNEVSIGMTGETNMFANIDLGDFAKYYNVDVAIIESFEIEIGF